MVPVARAGGTSAPLAEQARGLVRWVCTKNPFYVISAGLFLAGLWISFGDPRHVTNTWALMSGLAGYTLLLAVTACLLVRFGQVWDDVRTVLLLVVLMFLATSVTFDEVLVLDRVRGLACYVGGFLFAAAVSEGVLRGIRLRLPAGFRVPYYLILGLFFLYPLALSRFVDQPRHEATMWGLFLFSSVAGLFFLTLLPAIRRGPEYVRDNGSPWPWPQYPWSLFVFLAVAVVGRSFLLCWSMHLLGNGERNDVIFGPYFLVPFGLGIAVLLLEMGIVARSRVVLWVAMALPLGLAALARFGHRTDPIYEEFLQIFARRLGGDPLFVTLAVVTAYYAYASLRRVAFATEALTGALAVLAVVGPDSLSLREFRSPQPIYLLAAAGLQLGLGLWQRASWRCLIGAGGVAAAIALYGPGLPVDSQLRLPIAFHLVLLLALAFGAIFADGFARRLRALGTALAFTASLAVIVLPLRPPTGLPSWTLEVYPFAMAMLLAGYGWLLGYVPSLTMSGVILTLWLVAIAWRGYGLLRHYVTGLDYLVGSMLVFALAVTISLTKSGLLPRWLAARREKAQESSA